MKAIHFALVDSVQSRSTVDSHARSGPATRGTLTTTTIASLLRRRHCDDGWEYEINKEQREWEKERKENKKNWNEKNPQHDPVKLTENSSSVRDSKPHEPPPPPVNITRFTRYTCLFTSVRRRQEFDAACCWARGGWDDWAQQHAAAITVSTRLVYYALYDISYYYDYDYYEY